MSSLFNGVSSLSSLLVLLAGLGGFMRTALLGSAAFATCFAAAFGRPRFFGTGLGSVTVTVSVVSSVTASVVFSATVSVVSSAIASVVYSATASPVCSTTGTSSVADPTGSNDNDISL